MAQQSLIQINAGMLPVPYQTVVVPSGKPSRWPARIGHEEPHSLMRLFFATNYSFAKVLPRQKALFEFWRC
jgi:hypothetical protein